MVIAYIIHNLSVGHNCWPLSYCWFGFLIIHMVSSYFRLPVFALALLFYCLTRICFIWEAMFPSTSHSSTMKSPVTFPFTLIVFSPIFMQEEKESPCSKNTPVIFPNPGISISHCSPSFMIFSPGMNLELLLVEILPPPSLFISTTSTAANISLFIGSGTPQASRYPSAPTLEHTFHVPSKSPSLL